MRRFRFAIASLALLALLAPSARAQAQAPATGQTGTAAPASTPADAADVLFREGNELAHQKRLAEAEQKYRAAWEIKKSYNIAGNLGIMEAEQGKWRDAAEHLWFALQHFPANGKPPQRTRLEQMFDKAREQVGVLVFPAKVEGGQVYVNKQSIRLSPELQFRWFVEAGTIAIEVLHPLYRRDSKTIEVAKGKEVGVVLDLVPTPASGQASANDPQATQTALAPAGQTQANQPPLPAQPPPQDGKLPVRKIVIGAGIGTSASLIGTGIASAVVSSQAGAKADTLGEPFAKASAADACGDAGPNAAVCSQIAEQLQKQTTFSNAAVWTFVAGGVTGVGTLVYAIIAPRRSSSTARVLPVAGAGSAGLMIRGQW